MEEKEIKNKHERIIIKNYPKSPATLELLKKVENMKLKWTAAKANNIKIKNIVPKLFI